MNRASAVVLPTTPPSSYHPGRIRGQADRQQVAISRFVARYPEYAKLSPDVIAQVAATYRDERGHALEQDLRDNGILRGARIDYKRPCGGEWDSVSTSDNAFLEPLETIQ